MFRFVIIIREGKPITYKWSIPKAKADTGALAAQRTFTKVTDAMTYAAKVLEESPQDLKEFLTMETDAGGVLQTASATTANNKTWKEGARSLHPTLVTFLLDSSLLLLRMNSEMILMVGYGYDRWFSLLQQGIPALYPYPTTILQQTERTMPSFFSPSQNKF